jgi:23S rRNA (adenine-N6)-dimethyltransferase
VLAVEKDTRLFRVLRARVSGYPRVACRFGDFLATPLPLGPYAVVSNVPFAITAALVRRLLHAARPPDEALLVLQREAAEKFAGVRRETLFSLMHKPWFEITIVGGLRRSDFAPPPRVASTLLRVRRRAVPLVREEEGYRAFVVAGFRYGGADVSRALRRQITAWQVKRLSRDLGFSPHAGASQLTFEQWLAVFRFVEHECLGHDPTPSAVA